MQINFKSLLVLTILMTGVSALTARATASYYANEIVYANQAGVDVTVGEALDDLYYASSNFANPRGAIISLMGKTAPEGYLVCDGTIYNINDYEKLADYIKEQFGKVNYFGGDGETTFAVPDLRGEFLRGTGTNSHTNQGSGTSVGIHQDGTVVPTLNIWASGRLGLRTTSSGEGFVLEYNQDHTIVVSSSTERRFAAYNATSVASSTIGYTIRPTNTAVLYCIKY